MLTQRRHARFSLVVDEAGAARAIASENSLVNLSVEVHFDDGGWVRIRIPDTPLRPIFAGTSEVCERKECSILLGLDTPEVDLRIVKTNEERLDVNVALQPFALGTIQVQPSQRSESFFSVLERVQLGVWRVSEEPEEVRSITRSELKKSVEGVEAGGPGAGNMLIGDVLFTYRSINVWTRLGEWYVALDTLRAALVRHSGARGPPSQLITEIDAALESLRRASKA